MKDRRMINGRKLDVTEEKYQELEFLLKTVLYVDLSVN